MKTLALTLVTLLLQAPSIQAKFYRQNVITYAVSPDAHITGQKIEYNDPDCDPGVDCLVIKTCKASGTGPTLSADKKYFACCLAGQRLLGSPETAFDCCADGHELAGSPQAGYHCCPTGYSFDGEQCKQVCKNGKLLVNGQCVCPEGTVEAQDGSCQGRKKPTKQTCSSGLESGEYHTYI
jgi:hypothetical protein